MANQTIIGNQITIHGRGSLVLPYKLTKRVSALSTETTQVSLAGRTLYFEVDGVPIREEMITDLNDPQGKLIVLENVQIVTLQKTATSCVIRDETDIAIGRPVVLWSGTIKRDGYIGAPDAVEGE